MLQSLALLVGREGVPDHPPFQVELLGETADPVRLASAVTMPLHGAVEGRPCDVVIVPSLFVREPGWVKGRYPRITEWIAERHARRRDDLLGLLRPVPDRRDRALRRRRGDRALALRPHVRRAVSGGPRHPERALVVAGARGELVSSGASTSWHDLVLYLIGRDVGPVAAQAVSKFFALQRHVDGLAPFIVFDPPREHGDAVVAAAQAWLDTNAAVATPVREMVRQSGLSERGFSRRFQAATGHAPLDYVQRLRVEQAKRRLERTGEPIEEIAWRVGYEDPSAFRRLFQRIAGISPGQYRRQFAQPLLD